jgi:hypothetical protein
MNDNHIEPWYELSTESFSGRYNRFSGANANNMFQCRNPGSTRSRPCVINPSINPPITLTEAGIDYLKSRALNSDIGRTIFVFAGDSQTHSITNGHSVDRAVINKAITERFIQKLLSVGYRPENILFANGNHDPTITNGESTRTRAFTDVLIELNVVRNNLGRRYEYGGKTYNTRQLYTHMGYYMKQFPNYMGTNLFGIVTNTNLGRSHGLQQYALEKDLEWVRSIGGSVIIVGHHRSTLPDMIRSRYDSIISAGISGHIHSFTASNSRRFVTGPPMTAMAPRPGLMVSTLDANLHVRFGESELHRYGGSSKHNAAFMVPTKDCFGPA